MLGREKRAAIFIEEHAVWFVVILFFFSFLTVFKWNYFLNRKIAMFFFMDLRFYFIIRNGPWRCFHDEIIFFFSSCHWSLSFFLFLFIFVATEIFFYTISISFSESLFFSMSKRNKYKRVECLWCRKIKSAKPQNVYIKSVLKN